MIKAILTDIEGTTSSLSFVKDVLFPYARERMADFVRDHAHDAAVRKLLNDVKHIVERDLSDNQVIEQLIRWIDEDKKITPLKALQGMIWEDGYRRGAFKGHVYEDAVRKLREWENQDIKLYVFSSGSVHAQKLLFAHTEYGDLTPLFSGYFDTTVGNKREAASYHAIAEAIDTDPSEILFLSDIKEELDAAHAAGMQTVWLVREGTLDAAAEHRQVATFDGLLTAGKKSV
ncbi:MAG: acireductone synthase [Gammaproteobacteria bacterium]|nr:acireductone synthase [Gammaproteobacteria bacterium]